MKAGTCLLALMLVAANLVAEKPPVVRIRSERLEIRGLPAVVAIPAVKRHLDTGLTTTLALDAELQTGRREKLAGKARVEVRYDLWDETYLLSVSDALGARRTSTVSGAGLAEWWRALVLIPLAGVQVGPGEDRLVTLTLVVIPFSEVDQEDARQWFLRSLAGDAGGKAERVGVSSGGQGESGRGDLASVLVAASIGRRSLLTFSWTVPLEVKTP